MNKSGIGGMTLYEKRGRNSKGQIMFHHMGNPVNAGSDMNVGSQNSMGMHQRNQTQIAPPVTDSVFRNSIMSNDPGQKLTQMNFAKNQSNNNNMSRTGPQRLSAKPVGGKQTAI